MVKLQGTAKSTPSCRHIVSSVLSLNNAAKSDCGKDLEFTLRQYEKKSSLREFTVGIKKMNF